MPLAVQEQAGPAFAVKPAESPELPVENGRVAAISRQGSLMGSPSSSLASAAGSRVCMETSSRIFKGGCPSCLQLSLPEMYHGCAETSSLNAADAQQPIRAVLRHQVLAADAQEVETCRHARAGTAAGEPAGRALLLDAQAGDHAPHAWQV